MVFLIIITITVVLYFIMVLVLFFLSLLSESIPSGTFLGWFFRSCLIPLGTFDWGGWSRKAGGGTPEIHFE